MEVVAKNGEIVALLTFDDPRLPEVAEAGQVTIGKVEDNAFVPLIGVLTPEECVKLMRILGQVVHRLRVDAAMVAAANN